MHHPAAVCLLLLLVGLAGHAADAECGQPTDPVCIRSCVQKIDEQWDYGMSIDVTLTFAQTVDSFSADLHFDQPLSNFETWASQIVTADNQTYTVTNTQWDGHHAAGSSETLFFMVNYAAAPATLTSVKLFGTELCVVP